MSAYEITIPAHEPDGFDMTVRVDAESWMAALRTGITRLQIGIDVKHIIVDLRDDGSVFVTEPTSGRTFTVRSAIAAPPPQTKPQAPPPRPQQQAPPPPVVARRPSPPPRPDPAPVAAPRDRAQEQRLVKAFHRTSVAGASAQTPADAADAFLAIALEIIPAEAGAVLFADIAQQDMFIAFAHGVGAQRLLNTHIPFGSGICGHAVLYGIGLAVNDVTRDFRFDPAVPEALGLTPHSLLSAPVQHAGRTFGALHLVNKVPEKRFVEADVAVLGYLASALGDFLERYLLRVA